MKIAVIGTGLIGSQVVRNLAAAGHDAVGHSRSTGVDLLTGDGLADALRGAEVVVDLSNSPTFDEASLDFFRTSVTNWLGAAAKAGVRHAVALSIVGVDQVPDVVYYQAKALQEDLVEAGPVPYSIVRATQFMEFVPAILDWTTDGEWCACRARRSSRSLPPKWPRPSPPSPLGIRCAASTTSAAPRSFRWLSWAGSSPRQPATAGRS
ncbi:SDR family oxidoreductase [Amycolatopsis pithecellobii]|uniref:SDR family oxidoreductase n=1 Tax=Amycolatopsis pithecellobii TaxID=664692 RepID=UPI001FE8817F|nr:NAD(P)H-binding protein [Amycolatopsis pithecellobii]